MWTRMERTAEPTCGKRQRISLTFLAILVVSRKGGETGLLCVIVEDTRAWRRTKREGEAEQWNGTTMNSGTPSRRQSSPSPRKDDQASDLQPQASVTTNHLTLSRFEFVIPSLK